MAKYISLNQLKDALLFIERSAVTGEEDAVRSVVDAIRNIKFVPADVEPVQKWIPCSERLPGKDDHCVIVTYKDGNDYFVKQMYYGKPYFSSKTCFYDSDSEYGDIEYRGVIAWMPLPAPYKGGEAE